MLAWEWPLCWLAGSNIHRSLEARLALLPLMSLASVLLYQATNSAIYYLVAMAVYFWAYSEGEVRYEPAMQDFTAEFPRMLTLLSRSSVPGHGPCRSAVLAPLPLPCPNHRLPASRQAPFPRDSFPTVVLAVVVFYLAMSAIRALRIAFIRTQHSCFSASRYFLCPHIPDLLVTQPLVLSGPWSSFLFFSSLPFVPAM